MLALKKIYFAIIGIYIITVAFELPIRYILSIVHIGEFIYIRDVLLLAGIIIFFLFENTKIVYLYFFIGLLFFTLVGIYFTDNIIEVGMAVKTILPFYYGILLSKKYDNFFLKKDKYLKILFWGIAFGMLLQYIFDDLPWFAMDNPKLLGAEGFTPHEMLVWLDDGLPFTRMSGFCRLHNTTAIYVSYIIIWYIVYKTKWLYLCLGGLILIGTLAKTSIAIYILLLITLMLKYSSWRKYILALKIQILLFGISLIFLPVCSLAIDSIQSELDTKAMLFLLGGFDDRLIYSWPVTIYNIITYGNIILGRGIGGVGLSTTLFDTKLMIKPPIDNFALFIYGTCGLIGVCLIIYYLNRVIKMRIDSKGKHFILLFTFVFFGNAIMADMTDTISMFLFGIAMFYVYQKNDLTKLGDNDEISNSTQ